MGALPGDQDAMTLRKGTLLLARFSGIPRSLTRLQSPQSPPAGQYRAACFVLLVNFVNVVNFIWDEGEVTGSGTRILPCLGFMRVLGVLVLCNVHNVHNVHRVPRACGDTILLVQSYQFRVF